MWGTLFFSILMKEEKSVGHTVFLHLNEGRKECGVHCFSPGVGKTRNETKQETKQETAPIITTKPKTLKPSPTSIRLTAPSLCESCYVQTSSWSIIISYDAKARST